MRPLPNVIRKETLHAQTEANNGTNARMPIAATSNRGSGKSSSGHDVELGTTKVAARANRKTAQYSARTNGAMVIMRMR